VTSLETAEQSTALASETEISSLRNINHKNGDSITFCVNGWPMPELNGWKRTEEEEEEDEEEEEKDSEEEEDDDDDLVSDFEHFNFPRLEIWRTREKRLSVQIAVVDVTLAEVRSATVGVCVALIENTHVINVWTPVLTTTYCLVPLFGFQVKSPRPDVVRILQREKKTLQTRVSFKLPCSR
jgi:hypothetical protein